MSHVTCTNNDQRSQDDLVVVKNLKVYYRLASSFIESLVGRESFIKAVDDVDLIIKSGETLCLVGESGSGKTTLGKAILRLVEITDGKIFFKGEDIHLFKGEKLKLFRRKAQMIFQDPYTSLDPRMRIGDQVKEPLEIHEIGSRDERREMVYKILQKVGLTPPEEFYYRYPHQLSGGQRQRAAIARALVTGPELIVADEPVANLDVSARAQIINLMKDLRKEMRLSYLVITHDFSVAWELCDRIAVMYLGKIVEEGPVREVFERPLHPYTQALISAIPKIRIRGEKFEAKKIRVIGEIPSSREIPRGCRFHPRCLYTMSICKTSEPSLIEVEKDHKVACHLYNIR
jgi:peptide/nickel transport system ATP-binding protein